MAKSKNTGKELESIVADIYGYLSRDDEHTTVKLDVKLPSPDGERQFDVVMTTVVAGGEVELITVIEVRDYASKLQVDAVDGFRSKMLDVGAGKGIIVSKSGFQRGAVKKAKRQKIDLYTVQRLDELKDFKIQTPTVVHFLKFGSILMSAKIENPSEPALDYSRIFIDDIHFFEMLRGEIARGEFHPNIFGSLSNMKSIDQNIFKDGSRVVDEDRELGVNTWSPPIDAKVEYRKRFSIKPIPIEGLEVQFHLYYEYYFGYLTDLPNTVAMSNILESSSGVFFKPSDLMDFQKLFNKFENLDEIPVRDAMNYHILDYKDFSIASSAYSRIVKKH